MNAPVCLASAFRSGANKVPVAGAALWNDRSFPCLCPYTGDRECQVNEFVFPGSAPAMRPRRRRSATVSVVAATLLVVGTLFGAVGILRPSPAGASTQAPTAYVVNGSGNSVIPINSATGSAGAAIPIGSTPESVAVTPDGEMAYVTNFNGSSVTPIFTEMDFSPSINSCGLRTRWDRHHPRRPDGLCGQLQEQYRYPDCPAVPTPPVPPSPWGPTLTESPSPPDGQTAYVTNAGSNTVTPIAIGSNTAGTAISVGSHPDGVAITPNGQTAYVTERREQHRHPHRHRLQHHRYGHPCRL